MEVMFHFAFELVKISLLSAAYATLLFLLLRVFRIRGLRLWDWLGAVALIWLGLFIFLFTYWGNHGLGDTAIIPIGHGKQIESINAMEHATLLSVTNGEGHDVETTKFSVKDGTVCGNCDSWFYEEKCQYFVYDTSTDSLKEFTDSSAYQAYARLRGLPPIADHGDFMTNYHAYWSGWRSWMLP